MEIGIIGLGKMGYGMACVILHEIWQNCYLSSKSIYSVCLLKNKQKAIYIVFISDKVCF